MNLWETNLFINYQNITMRKIILLSLSVFLFSFYSVYFIIYEKEEVFAFTSEREGGFEVDVAGSDVAWVWKWRSFW